MSELSVVQVAGILNLYGQISSGKERCRMMTEKEQDELYGTTAEDKRRIREFMMREAAQHDEE